MNPGGPRTDVDQALLGHATYRSLGEQKLSAAGVNPFVPALAATFAASFGFMLPVSTPQNAIAYGSGVVPITTMIRSGASFDVIGAILIILLLPPLIGLTGIGG